MRVLRIQAIRKAFIDALRLEGGADCRVVRSSYIAAALGCHGDWANAAETAVSYASTRWGTEPTTWVNLARWSS